MFLTKRAAKDHMRALLGLALLITACTYFLRFLGGGTNKKLVQLMVKVYDYSLVLGWS